MKSFREKYKASGKYSQFGEHGVLTEILKRIGLKNSTAVEFGGHDGKFCSNTAELKENGWKVFMFDMEPRSPTVEKRTITPDNVNQLPVCEVLSIDCDGPDYHIWKAYKAQPSVVIIEVNSSIPPTVEEIPGDQGASYRSMVQLGIEKGYFLVCHTANCIFVANEFRHFFPEIIGNGLDNYQDYFDPSHLNA